MSTWTTAVDDLRTKINDKADAKLRAVKPVIGVVDGVNATFKTFENRRTTDFTVSGQAPLGVYQDGTLLPPSAVSSDDTQTGFFTMAVAPSGRQQVEAAYYYLWFTDLDLTEYLRLSNNWLGFGDDYTVMDPGLRPAALAYAAAECYQQLALRYTQTLSSIYRLEDAPNQDNKVTVEYYTSLTDMFRKEAYRARDDFYQRQGQPLAPLRGYVTLGAGAITPQR